VSHARRPFGDNYRIPADHLIGRVEGQGFHQTTGGLKLRRIGVASRGVGIAEGALELAIRCAQICETFGRPIAEHQAIRRQRRLVRMSDAQASRHWNQHQLVPISNPVWR
jgi:alkylation response protein AidB-like acyl-CoA dehydrogenase